MYRRVSPSLVKETAILIQDFEEIKIGLRSQPIEVTNFKVGPLVKYVSPAVGDARLKNLRNGNDCRSPRHHRSTSPYHCPQECALDVIS